MPKNDRPTFTADDPQAAAEAIDEITQGEDGSPSRAELRERAEKLTAQAQKLLEQIEIETADPEKVKIDNEVRQALNEMNEVFVSNAQDDHAYAWVYRDPYNQFGGRYVRKMQALGWEVVSGSREDAKRGINAEGIEHLHVDGTRVVSDCLLMRIRLDRKLLLEKRDRLLREAQQVGIEARVYALADQAKTRVLNVDEIAAAMGSPTVAEKARARGDFHRMNATGKMDRMLRTGTIPGVPRPGAGR